MKGKGFNAHESARAATVEWYTPVEKFIDPLGGADSFDLDPCSPIASTGWALAHHPYSETARWRYCVADDGLAMKWFGRVWMNPPYTDGIIGLWLEKLADHGTGTALIFNRSDTAAYQRQVRARASGILYVAGRIAFIQQNGQRATGNSGAPLVVVAYGEDDLERLSAAAQAPVYRGNSVVWNAGRIPGSLEVLRSRTMMLIFAPTNEDAKSVDATWREVISEFVDSQPGPFALADLYEHVRAHPKAAGNRNVEAKARQQLQRGVGQRVSPGVWASAQMELL